MDIRNSSCGPRSRIWQLGGLCLALVVGTACDSAGGPQTARADADRSNIDDVKRSPVETAHSLQACFQQRDFDNVEALVVSARRTEMVQFLRAVDGLIEAHTHMQIIAAERFGSRVRHAFNLGDLENNLGIFSKDVEFLAQHFKGETATVSLQVAARVPLIRARFVRQSDRWYYDPPPTPVNSIAALNALTDDIEKIASALQAGMSPLAYHEAVTRELIPGMLQVAQRSTMNRKDVQFTDAEEMTDEP